MNTTAKNYAAQVLREIKLAEINNITNSIKTLIPIAIHFSLPENGRILDDDLKGIADADIRLPFEVITVNYEMDGVKICVIAAERRRKNNPELFDVYASFACKAGSDWLYLPYMAILDRVSSDLSTVNYYFFDVDGKNCMPDINSKRAMAACGRAVFELVEALTCSNVSHEPIEKINPAVNARRIRDGKLPLYETRCLVINAPNKLSVVNPQGGSHASPRQHLRRGHIRRLADKNIWVNSCVVAASNPARIAKSYKVMAA